MGKQPLINFLKQSEKALNNKIQHMKLPNSQKPKQLKNPIAPNN